MGPYEILASLGAGGMGEVYRGRDTRLGRDVAIKILPAGFAHNEDLRARFEREARTISSLNHPNICTLFDVGREDGTHFLVMELIEGESLADRLQKGPLPQEQVIRWGAQIADALSSAHRQGIVHRDLKPGNVMLAKSGAKLLDFGLARAAAGAAPVQGLTEVGTQARPLTQEGTIIGTFQYMSPEQLEGLEADARSDIFSLGALLYEMTTGERAFQGRNRTSLIAAIVSGTPRPIGELAPLTPPGLEHVIRRCLAKDPEHRWQSAADIASELRWISEAGSKAGEAAPVLARRRLRLRAAWGLHALTATVAVLATLGLLRLQTEPPRMVSSSLMPPQHMRFDTTVGAPSLSPDGKRFVFVAMGEDGKTALWIRSIESLSAQPLAGTDGASHPFWSPDSRQVAFYSMGKLRRIDASGGPTQPICDATQGRGGAWGEDGTILFTPGPGEPLYRVPATGGTPSPITELNASRKELSHRYAEYLPGGRRFVYLVEGSSETPGTEQGFAVYAGSLDSKDTQQVLATNGQVRYDPGGYLLFLRAGALVAQRFDAPSLTLSGEARPIMEKVRRNTRYEGVFSLSREGLLLSMPGSSTEASQLIWMDRAGKDGDPVGKSVDYRVGRLSHDGTRIAASVQDPSTAKADIWVLDIARGTSTKLTFDPEDDVSPVWSLDDKKIYFTSRRQGRGDIFAKSSFGTGSEELIYESPGPDTMVSLSPEGQYGWIMSSVAGKPARDIVRVALQDGKGEVFLGSPFDEFLPAVSPDGRWLAYVSDESGRSEVYVQTLSSDGGKWQISTDGGTLPSWTRGGRELIFQGRDNRLMRVDIQSGGGFQAGVPAALFDPRTRPNIVGRLWDVSSDGERFLVNRSVDAPEVEPLTLIQNWKNLVER